MKGNKFDNHTEAEKTDSEGGQRRTRSSGQGSRLSHHHSAKSAVDNSADGSRNARVETRLQDSNRIDSCRESVEFLSRMIPGINFTECYYDSRKDYQLAPNQNTEIVPILTRADLSFKIRKRKDKESPWGEYKPYELDADACGYLARVPAGWARIDLDGKEDEETGNIVKVVPNEFKELYAATLVTETKKGWHLWVRAKRQWKSSGFDLMCDGLKMHIDICADKRGVFVPGSRKEKGGSVTHVFPDTSRPIVQISDELEDWIIEKLGECKEKKPGKAASRERKRMYTSRHDNVPDDWKLFGTSVGRHDLIRDAIYGVAQTTRLDDPSLVVWGMYFNELMCDTPRSLEDITAMVEGLKGKRHDEDPNTDIFIPWKRHIREMRKSSGFAQEMLHRGFISMGMEIRLNMRKDCVEIQEKVGDEWKSISKTQKHSFSAMVSPRFVTGLKVVPKDKKRGGKKKQALREDENSSDPIELEENPWCISPPVAFKWSGEEVYSALCNHAINNIVDPWIVEFLDALPVWDKTDRLYDLFDTLFQVDYDRWGIPEEMKKPMVKLAIRSFFLGILDRTFNPGCKHDEAVVLVSEDKGIGKSTFCRFVLPDDKYFKDGFDLRNSSKKNVEETQGKVVVECSELQGMDERHMTKIQATFSTSNQTVRLSYRTDAEDYAARHIFIGTTNERTPMPYDSNGWRRFILIPMKKGARPPEEVLPEILQQIWAEALHRWRNGETGKLTGEEIEMVKMNSRDFMQEPDMKGAVREVLKKLRDVEQKNPFYDTDVEGLLDKDWDINFDENGSDKRREMRRQIYASKLVSREKSGKSWRYAFKGVKIANPFSEDEKETKPEFNPTPAPKKGAPPEAITDTKNYFTDLANE